MGKKSPKKVIIPPVEKKLGLGGTTFGGFQDPGYITIDDEYVKKTEVPTRHTGSNFLVSPARKGRTPDVYFDKEVRSIGDLGKLENEKKRKEPPEKKPLSGPWKHASPSKKSTGSGTYMGTFSEKNPFGHEQDYEVVKKTDKPEPPRAQKANVACPKPKLGGFGVIGPDIYFSQPEPPKDNKGDLYDSHRIREKEEKIFAKKKQIGFSNGGKPFRPATKKRTTFDEAEASGVSKIYSIEKQLPPLKETKKTDKDHLLAGPFKYTSPPKSGDAGCLSGYPRHIEGKSDAYDAKQLREKEERKKAPKLLGGVWKATSGPKVGCTKSLIRTTYFP
ncbi:hypothetical protein DIPPA_09493 [Diplonema papillatum]|nr:hypothetical protein DIPPA_09493 [Diplonema papillatum]